MTNGIDRSMPAAQNRCARVVYAFAALIMAILPDHAAPDLASEAF
jgi:hypothetical protein